MEDSEITNEMEELKNNFPNNLIDEGDEDFLTRDDNDDNISITNENNVNEDVNEDDKQIIESNEQNSTSEEYETEESGESEETKEQRDEIDDYLVQDDDVLSENNTLDGENNEKSEYSYTIDNNDDKDENVYKSIKVSADEAEKHKESSSKPKVLNKKFLFTVIVVTFCCIILITFITPTKKKSNSEQDKKIPEQYSLSDYSSYARNDPYDAKEGSHYGENSEEELNNPKYKKRETQYDENGNVVIPPVVEEKPKYQYTGNANTGGGGGGATTVEIPDTRNDSLQGKSIMGIKGLTSSQERYSTDYQATIAKNVSTTNPYSPMAIPSKEEMLSSALSAYGQYTNDNAQDGYSRQNDQSGKNNFYNKGRDGVNVGQGKWLDMNTIWQGTIFEAVLTSDLNTDLPGEITARVSKNIYSSQDGRYLLIPQNSILYGTYNSSISYSQKRVQVGWHTIVRPDGYSIDIGNMNGTDAKGASGLKGFINEHPMAYLKAIGLMSTVSIINSEFQNSMATSTNEYVQNILANSQEVANELGEKLIDRAMNVQPTITIKSGTKLNIVANRNLTIPPMEQIPVTQKYMRNKRK